MVGIDYKKTYDIVLQSWLRVCLKNVLSDKLTKLTTETLKNLKVELTERGEKLGEVKIQRGIFQGDALSPLLFVIAMKPLNHILRKCTRSYKFTKLQEKINHFMYMDDIKLFTNNEKQLVTLIQTIRIYSQDIEMEFGIKMCRTNNEKLKNINDRRNRTAKGRKNQNTREKKKKITCSWEYLKRTPSNKWRWKKKWEKSATMNEKSQTKLCNKNLIKGINTWTVVLVR